MREDLEREREGGRGSRTTVVERRVRPKMMLKGGEREGEKKEEEKDTLKGGRPATIEEDTSEGV